MKSIDQLINTTDPGWTLVRDWISKASNQVEVLPNDSARAQDALFRTQVTTRSPMGAIVYETGGILIDNGWIRILGSGHAKLNRTLPDWNKGKSFAEIGDPPGFLLVADDVAGGFFAINGGLFGNDSGKLYYLAPDTVEWESLDFTYSDFLHFCFNGNLESFYQNLRWSNWKPDIAALDGNKIYSFFPFLFTKEGKDINKVEKKAVPIEEHYLFTMEMQRQLNSNPKIKYITK